MKAWQITEFGTSDVFQLVDLPDPEPRPGWVVIDIKAFGINRSELYSRQGHSGGAVTVPRVLGIECVGVVRDGGGTDLKVGQSVAAAMGQMGRKYDGGYAEKTIVPRGNVYAIPTPEDWSTAGAIPEMFLTAWGGIHESIGLQSGQSLMIRGGSSSVGLAASTIAKEMGCLVISTTRKPAKADRLRAFGAAHVVIDNGKISEEVRELSDGGVNGVIELVGVESSIIDSLSCCRRQGTVAMIGFLGNQWDYTFFPWMPSTVRLSLYSTETLTTEYATPALNTIMERVNSGAYEVAVDEVFAFDDLPKAHQKMEANLATGKLVVRV